MECCSEPLSHIAVDLGVTLRLQAWMLDSWCTRVRCRLEDQPFPYAVAGATLTAFDSPYVTDAPMTPCDVRPLLRVERDPQDAEAAWLVFGPLPEQTVHVLLEIDRLQVPQDPDNPDIYLNPFADPFEGGDADLADALEMRFGTARGQYYDLAPGWECRGLWGFRLTVPQRMPTGRQAVARSMAVGRHRLDVPWLDRGTSGVLLALDVVPEELVAWGDDWRQQALRAVRDEPGTVLPQAPRLRVALDGSRGRIVGRPCGPWGPLQMRHYAEFTPTDGDRADHLLVEEVHGVLLSEAWEHGFDRARWEATPTFDFSLEAAGFPGQGCFTITNIYDDESALIISYRITLDSDTVSAVWPQAATLYDSQGVEHPCQGDGTHWIDGATFSGLMFPSPDVQHGAVVLCVGAVDLALSAPLVFDLHGPSDPDPA